MKAVRVLLLLVLAFLALLSVGLSSPAVADWGNIAVIALRGQTVAAPPAPTIKLADFGPPDVNDVLQVTFVGMNDDGGGAAGPPCVLYRSTAGTLEALAYDLQATSLPPEYGPLELCPYIFERPPMLDGAGGVVFQGRVPGPSAVAKGIFFGNAPSTSVTAIVYEGQTGTPIGGDFGPPTLMDYTSQCDNAVDDDGDNWVNDGCPPLVTAENPLTECDNAIDDDGDGRVNDGCPTVAPTAETALQVLFHATVTGGGSAPEGLFLATGPNASSITFTKVVAPGDTVIGGTIGNLGDASMNNSGDVAYQADISGVAPLNEGIFLAGGGGGGAHTKVVGADAPETGTQCTEPPDSALDDDGDGYYNEGCPADEGKEEGSECNGNADEDGDGRVNDGCPVNGDAESGLQCDNDTDDDGDAYAVDDVNDGCPGHGVEESGDDCNNNTDDDADTLVNDGCPTHGDTWDGDPNYDNTLRAVGEPRINDAGIVAFKAEASADYGEGYFVAASEPVATAMQQSPSLVGESFSCGLGSIGGFGSFGRHGITGKGDLVIPGCGSDPLEAVIVFPWYRKVAVTGEVAPPPSSNTYQTFSDSSTSDDDSDDEDDAVAVAYKASTSADDCSGLSHACGGVFGGSVTIKDSDGDGIPDDQEENGVNEDNQGGVDLDLPGMGADPLRKDLFVEVDYMDCTVGTWPDNNGDTIPDDGLPADCAVGDTHNHKPIGGIIEDGVLGQTCDDGVDNSGDGKCDALGCGALPPDPDCLQQGGFMGEGPGSCSDNNDNDNDGFIDGADWDCQCHYRVTSAVGSIDWNMNNIIEGISQNAPNKLNIGAVIREPWSGGVPWCATAVPGATLEGHDDWSHIKLIFRQAGAFGANMPHGPVPFDAPAGGYRDDDDGDGLANIADNCPDDANSDQANGDGDGRGNVCDNCPSDWNPGQMDNESDGIGDICDPDDDNDLMLDTYEEANTCLQPLVDDAWQNFDGDELKNYPEMVVGTDPCVADLDFANDTDTDGFSDGIEQYIGTLHLDKCPETSAPNDEDPDAWPLDMDDDQDADVFDIMKYIGYVGVIPPVYSQRLDLDVDGDVDIFDVMKFVGIVAVPGKDTCTNS